MLQSRRRDVSELPVTSLVGRCDTADEQASVTHAGEALYRHHGQQQQQQQQEEEATSRQYVSERCVVLTYFSGDVQSHVDQHFARALSRPTSFSRDYRGSTPPALHTAVPPHCTAWLGKSEVSVTLCLCG